MRLFQLDPCWTERTDGCPLGVLAVAHLACLAYQFPRDSPRCPRSCPSLAGRTRVWGFSYPPNVPGGHLPSALWAQGCPEGGLCGAQGPSLPGLALPSAQPRGTAAAAAAAGRARRRTAADLPGSGAPPLSGSQLACLPCLAGCLSAGRRRKARGRPPSAKAPEPEKEEQGQGQQQQQHSPQQDDDAAAMSTTGASGAASSSSGPSHRLQQTQSQVDEVVDIMRVNVDKVLERDQKLSELDDRADALQAGAAQFETNAAKLKRKFWWKNCKMWAILIAVVVVLLIIIIVWSTSS
ncbi:vesicle-associated membrane protein 3 [Sceloporus undulatus]|uniref:vesicle-associated membrane protein 3 n=1 Tax=Sceloporus undulatus TaxID=8520 RepID=UPI001C4BE307|nr:vesicle-associated membrane protein 3 [Sceloporus undulatus]